MSTETEIIITPSPRGYRVEFPKWCVPSSKLVAVFRAFKWLSYHEATPDRPAYRLFPADQLDFMTRLLNHWYAEQSASALVGRSRNGSRLVTVRVVEAEPKAEEKDYLAEEKEKFIAFARAQMRGLTHGGISAERIEKSLNR